VNIYESINKLPRFSFLSPPEGGVKRWENASGDWIERHEVIQLLEALHEQSHWMPMETAPKDGTNILLRSKNKKRIADGEYNVKNKCWVWPYISLNPHSWKPVP